MCTEDHLVRVGAVNDPGTTSKHTLFQCVACLVLSFCGLVREAENNWISIGLLDVAQQNVMQVID
jgi:hypothetical protein